MPKHAPKKTATTRETLPATLSPEERIRLLEKRVYRLENRHAWQTSWPYRSAVAVALYIASAFVMISLMIPGWPVAAVIPVICYALTLIGLSLLRKSLQASLPDNRKL